MNLPSLFWNPHTYIPLTTDCFLKSESGYGFAFKHIESNATTLIISILSHKPTPPNSNPQNQIGSNRLESKGGFYCVVIIHHAAIHKGFKKVGIYFVE